MDGVLIDAKEWHYEALNQALKLFGCEISRFDHVHTFDGLPTKDKLELLGRVSYLPTELHEFINQLKQQYTMEIITQKCKPLFQHEYALSRLKREGYLLAVCSNSKRKTIIEMMERAELLEYLDLIMSNEDVEKAKPNPEIYITTMKKLNLQPEECLILEDNKNGIAAAIASGGHLLKIDTVYDVNYTNIRTKLQSI
jgi:HAD superfamily hydrolase (TIGR01509 family)